MISEPSETFSGVFWSFPRPRGGCGRLRSSPGTRPDLAGVPDAPRGSCGRLRIYQGTRLMYPASLAGVPDAFHSPDSDHCTAIFEI